MIALEMSVRGILRDAGLKVGAISRGRFEQRIQDLVTERDVSDGIAKAGDVTLRRALRPSSCARRRLTRRNPLPKSAP